jgi:hypothetical protein
VRLARRARQRLSHRRMTAASSELPSDAAEAYDNASRHTADNATPAMAPPSRRHVPSRPVWWRRDGHASSGCPRLRPGPSFGVRCRGGGTRATRSVADDLPTVVARYSPDASPGTLLPSLCCRARSSTCVTCRSGRRCRLDAGRRVCGIRVRTALGAPSKHPTRGWRRAHRHLRLEVADAHLDVR